MHAASHTRAEVKRRLEESRRVAIERADRARNRMAHMAWWAFGVAAVSATGSVVGGTIAAMVNVA